MKYLIDSNIWIYAAQGISPVVKFLSYALEEDWAGYSSISRVEVMGFPELTIEDEGKISDILSIFHEVDIRKNVIDMAIKIRREKKIKVPDAIVASTALLNNAVLVTRNVSDFKGLNGLDLLNPFK